MTATPGGIPGERRQRNDVRRNRERLIAAAQETFAEAGPEASLNEIARRAGVGSGTLYRHFPTRSALLAAVLSDRVRTLCGTAEKLRAAESADDALDAWLRAFLAHARTNQGLGGAAILEGADALDLDCHRLILEAAAGLLTRAQRQGTARADLTPEDLIQLVVGIALSTARNDDTEQSDRLLGLVLDAVHGARGGGHG
ncbi:TetR/AcrR family transcriptional regulator [Streptomyces inhibens]|uniref:TetR/AcrR family transcriptional regulator n=1 Tax=Streptomyces inhibens TaxID=2293571 RepID=A0A371Q3S0_STRIH|nr:TetR/AcrR family transcriptional regulator [Streptomyces inhibens]REK89385.1 TetR/AcrR family transcriptional regulator [Streptomyces inhibens]